MASEVEAHTKNNHWKLILKSQVPHGTQLLPSVWAMKCKWWISTWQIYKWKACLNLHDGKQEYGVMITGRNTQLPWHGLLSDFYSPYPSSSHGTTVRLILHWSISRLMLRVFSTWWHQMGLRLGRTGTSIVYRFSSTSMEKNRLVAHDHYI